MSKEQNESIHLNKIGWSFKEVCKIAKVINFGNWCIVESNDKIAFIEIKLPRTGPAVLQKQLILSNYLQVEIFVGSCRVSNEILNINNIASVTDLQNCLETLGSLKTCLGNRNFRRTNKSNSSDTTRFWRHSQCLLLHDQNHSLKESCCDNCLSLNCFLPKQKGVVIPAVLEDDDEEVDPIRPLLKKFKEEIIESEQASFKQEIFN